VIFGEGIEDNKIYINKTQYFDAVTQELWAFHIGGYQVCQKWLKDRKGRQLSYDDCKHYLTDVTQSLNFATQYKPVELP